MNLKIVSTELRHPALQCWGAGLNDLSFRQNSNQDTDLQGGNSLTSEKGHRAERDDKYIKEKIEHFIKIRQNAKV